MNNLLHHRLLVLLPHVGGCHPGNRLSYKIHLWMWPWTDRIFFYNCLIDKIHLWMMVSLKSGGIKLKAHCLASLVRSLTKQINFTQHWQHCNHLGTFSTRWQSTDSARRHKEGGFAGQRCRNRVLGELCSAEVAILTMIAHSNLPFVIQVPGI